MKNRIIAIILVVVLIPCFIVVPTKASENPEYFHLVHDKKQYILEYNSVDIFYKANLSVEYSDFYIIGRFQNCKPYSADGSPGTLVWVTTNDLGIPISCYKVQLNGYIDGFVKVKTSSSWAVVHVFDIITPSVSSTWTFSGSACTSASGILSERVGNKPIHQVLGLSFPSTFVLSSLGDSTPGYFEINVPCDMLAGFDYISFSVIAESNTSDIDTFGSGIQSISLFNDGNSIPFDVCLTETLDQDLDWSFVYSDSGSNGLVFEKPYWEYASIRFVPPAQGYVTIRFTYLNESEQLGLKFINLYGFYSSGLTEFDYLLDMNVSISSIEDLLKNILSSINIDSSAADGVVDNAAGKADQLDRLTGQMDSLAKPDLSGSGDISGIISPGDLTSYTTFLSSVVNVPYISQVVMLSLILSLAAYVLFGKR